MIFCVYSGGQDQGNNGNTLSDVLKYNAATDQWEKTGDMNTPRRWHAASAVKWDVVAPFCS